MKEKNNPIECSLSQLMPQSESEKHILSQRAQHLAESITNETETLQTQYYVRFKLGDDEYYGVPYEYIKEVTLNITPTKVPNTPEWIAGIINRNGILLSVLNLKPFFHISSKESPKQTHLIVLNYHDMVCALMADTIEGSYNFAPTALDAPLATENAIKSKYIVGLHQGITAILNIETLLSDLQSKTSAKENKQ